MGILKKLFGKKKEKDVALVEEELELIEEVGEDIICSECNMTIHPDQRIKTFAGKKMHMKPCWFKLRKTAKSLM